MSDVDADVESWNVFVDGLRSAGERLAANTAGLAEAERADGFRALLHTVANQLGRFEVDRERPELVAFNGWRQKFMMDNPDFGYWVADIRDDQVYRVVGNRGDAVYTSITAYASAGPTTIQASARLDSDAITFDETGGFEVTVGGDEPGTGSWLSLPAGASALWVRYFYDDARTDRLGSAAIEPIQTPPVPDPIDPAAFRRQLRMLGATTAAMPQIFAAATAEDLRAANELRHWSEMTGGAVFTEPGIHYLRGGWQLRRGEALLIEGDVVACRYWNILAYSRYLNSLDYRYRTVSYTGATATIVDDRYRFIVCAENPSDNNIGAADWIDSEGREVGIIVMRFLQPTSPPELPSVRRVRISDIEQR